MARSEICKQPVALVATREGMEHDGPGQIRGRSQPTGLKSDLAT